MATYRLKDSGGVKGTTYKKKHAPRVAGTKKKSAKKAAGKKKK